MIKKTKTLPAIRTQESLSKQNTQSSPGPAETKQPSPPSDEETFLDDESNFRLGTWFFLRTLGLVYLFAFASAWAQIVGLVGKRGILSIDFWLRSLAKTNQAGLFWDLPTIFWWNSSDAMLHAVCAAGVGFSILLLVGMAPAVMLVLLWGLYLSVVVAGQLFFSYQWDVLLLEVGFLSIFLAPWSIWPRHKIAEDPPRVVIWLLWWLLFRLMFFSGYVKLASGDPAWRDLSAMQYHYWTQPLPSWVSWYAHQLPKWLHETSVLAMYAIELIAPFALLLTRIPRMVAAIFMIGLHVMIGATGNYGFFGLLSAALCLLLFDDAAIRQYWPSCLRRWLPKTVDAPPPPPWQRYTRLTLMIAILPLVFVFGVFKEIQRFTYIARQERRTAEPPKSWWQKLQHTLGKTTKTALRAVALENQPRIVRHTYYKLNRFRTVNGYGLFAVMTKTRPEIVIEGSADGKVWKEYAFRWKPGDIRRAPSIVGPHMPRLDWQMWFAALRGQPPRVWVQRFAEELLRGSPPVLGLLQHNPFAKKPPRFVRALMYRYTFAPSDPKTKTKAWWQRMYVGVYLAPMQREFR